MNLLLGGLYLGMASSTLAQTHPVPWPEVTCESGMSLFHFSMTPSPTLSEEMPVLFGGHSMPAHSPRGEDHQAQLSVCLSADVSKVELKRIIFSREPYTAWTPPHVIMLSHESSKVESARKTGYRLTTVPVALVRQEGLLEALFGDLARLSIMIPLDLQGHEVRMLPFDQNGQWYAGIALWWRRPNEANATPLAPLIGGDLKPGETFQDRTCPTGEGSLRWQLDFESVRLTLNACWHQIGVSGRSFKLRDLRIEDHAMFLSEIEQQPWILQNPAPEQFSYLITHHNECDSLVIRLPHAAYGITLKRRPGLCIQVLEGAPNWDIPTPSGRGFQYQIQYTNGQVMTGTGTFVLAPPPLRTAGG